MPPRILVQSKGRFRERKKLTFLIHCEVPIEVVPILDMLPDCCYCGVGVRVFLFPFQEILQVSVLSNTSQQQVRTVSTMKTLQLVDGFFDSLSHR